jgi:hypothetical protein
LAFLLIRFRSDLSDSQAIGLAIAACSLLSALFAFAWPRALWRWGLWVSSSFWLFLSLVFVSYGLVVAGKRAAEELLPNTIEVQALRDKLDLMQSELRMTREHLLALQQSGQQQQERITSLGTDVAELRLLMAHALGPGG